MKVFKKSILVCIALMMMCGTFGIAKVDASAEEVVDDDPMKFTQSMYTDCTTESQVANGPTLNFVQGSSSNYGSVTNKYWGIDVSKYQGDIDWNAVKAAGVRFAFVRVGYRGSEYGTLQEDPYFRKNLAGANAAGIKTGAYIFSQALNEQEAVEEANFLMNKIQGYNINYATCNGL